LEKYISKEIIIPKSNKKLSILPIPKYLRSRNNINAMEINSPRLEFANIEEKKKRNRKKLSIKNRRIIPGTCGEMK